MSRPDFAEIANNLLTLEINTVQKDGMSGQKMPQPHHAILDLADDYRRYLCAKAQDFGSPGSPLEDWAYKLSAPVVWGREPFPQGRDRAPHLMGAGEAAGFSEDFLTAVPRAVDARVLDDFREVAKWTLAMRSRTAEAARTGAVPPTSDDVTPQALGEREWDRAREVSRSLNSEDDAVLYRIVRTCDQFKEMFDRLKVGQLSRSTSPEDFKPEPADRVLIRKSWDIGTEAILMQTVIQIDGDVVSRFQKGMDKSSRATLHKLHGEAVDVSFKYWRWLIEALGRLAGKSVSSLFDKP